MKESSFHDIWVRNVGMDSERPSLAAQSIVQSFLCSLTDKTEERRKTILITGETSSSNFTDVNITSGFMLIPITNILKRETKNRLLNIRGVKGKKKRKRKEKNYRF